MLIVGSKALTKSFTLPDRRVNDTDVIGTYSDFLFLKEILNPKEILEKEKIISLKNITPSDLLPDFLTKNVEILLSDNSKSLNLYLDYDEAHEGIHFASPEVLFSLKKSHIHFPIKFHKHIMDYCFLYEHFKGEDILSEITKINFLETEERVGKLKTPSLYKSTKSFFRQSEKFFKSYFVHDHIHLVMAHGDRPMYEKMQYNLESAKCEKVLWDKFTFEEKCKCVLEESYVIALERKMIPMIFGSEGAYTAEESFKWAIMRVCTTLCSGWFRQFATDNYTKILKYYKPNYVEIFLESFDKGLIKKL